jgi:hypothetical protein
MKIADGMKYQRTKILGSSESVGPYRHLYVDGFSLLLFSPPLVLLFDFPSCCIKYYFRNEYVELKMVYGLHTG